MNRTDERTSDMVYRRTIDALTDGVLLVGPGGIEYVNPAFTRMSGYRLDEVAGQDPFLLASDELDRGSCDQAWRTVRQGCPWQGRMVYRWKDDTLCEQDVTLAPVSSADGEPTRFVMMMSRCAERRALERQSVRAQKLGVVGILAGNIAHDFNNLLTVIGSNIEIVLESISESDPGSRFLLEGQKALAKAAELTRDLLDFSRKALPRWIDCDLSQVVAEAVRLMRHVLAPEVKLRTRFSSEPLALLGDPAQLHHLIVGLCLDAQEAMPGGGVLTLSTLNKVIDDTPASTIPNARAGKFVVLRVEASAADCPKQDRVDCAKSPAGDCTTATTGRPPQTLDEKSEAPFAQTPHPGGELGLAVVRDVVETYQGWIDVESSLGQSARVDVYLPLRTTPDARPKPVIDPALLHGTGTVLLIDDHPTISALLRTVLESRGYQAMTADTAAKAVSLFEQCRQTATAVVLDWDMPGIDVLGIFQALRRLAPALGIVLISDGTTGTGTPIPADESTRFVAKPFTPTEVLEALKSVPGTTNRSTSSEA